MFTQYSIAALVTKNVKYHFLEQSYNCLIFAMIITVTCMPIAQAAELEASSADSIEALLAFYKRVNIEKETNQHRYEYNKDVTPLMLAALHNDEKEIEKLLGLDELAQINAQTYHGITALFLALRHDARHSNVVAMLVDAGADISLVHPCKCPETISYGEIVGKDPEMRKKNRFTLNNTGAHNSFEVACARGHDNVVKALIAYDRKHYASSMLKQHGASGLRHAAFGGAIAVIQLLLAAGVYVEGIEPGHCYDTTASSALKVAVLNLQDQAAAVLLASGADTGRLDLNYKPYVLPPVSVADSTDIENDTSEAPIADADRASRDVICVQYCTQADEKRF